MGFYGNTQIYQYTLTGSTKCPEELLINAIIEHGHGKKELRPYLSLANYNGETVIMMTIIEED